MSIKVKIPTLLRALTGEHKEVETSGGTIAEIIGNLEEQYPGIRERLMKGENLHKFMNIYVNENDIRFLESLSTPVSPNDTITILPAVAGG